MLPAGVPVLRGQINRVAEPNAADFVIMTPLRQRRIETNVDTYADVAFTASINGSVMAVTSVLTGTIDVGAQLFGVGLASGTTTITGVLSGTGGVGTYLVNPSQNLASTVLAAGTENLLQPSEIVIQLDVHGPNSADNAQIITTLFRDDYGVQQFLSSSYDVAPLYADDPKQLPFTNDQSQWEDRWIIEAYLQANQVVTLPQQFADALQVSLNLIP